MSNCIFFPLHFSVQKHITIIKSRSKRSTEHSYNFENLTDSELSSFVFNLQKSKIFKASKMVIPTNKLQRHFSLLLCHHVENVHKFYHPNEISSYNLILELNARLQIRVCTGEKQYKHLTQTMYSQVQHIRNQLILGSKKSSRDFFNP